MAVLTGIEPKEVFDWFEQICAIPHGSSNTKRISDFLVDFAVQRGLRYRQDEWNNVIIWKDASAGYEQSAPVMLQSVKRKRTVTLTLHRKVSGLSWKEV